MARFISPTNFAKTLSACARCSPSATTRFQSSPSIFLAMASPKSDREEYRESFEILQLQMGSIEHRVVAKFAGLMNLAVSFNVGGSIVLTQNPAFHCQQIRSIARGASLSRNFSTTGAAGTGERGTSMLCC
ncbi:hypothetical protein CRG98_048304 [Punica granatum]|uniref:Uncharacterized protein n=1 Tax=Punica granatum TaxID=22663 RepID=A0A2I0HJ04_PUNGR|nr:hypothetical protein CRG98_048304 [Punica granatum]